MVTPTNDPDFDVIVVGAGPAGATAAHRLASGGLSVVLIERAEVPGAKNLSGGVLYASVLEELFPGFADEAPIERRITRHVTTFLTADSAVSLDYSSHTLGHPVNGVTVLRARFDPWLVGKAEEAGALLMPGIRVDSLLTQAGPDGRRQVAGVRAGDEELRAPVVVAADGVNSFLARDAGLRRTPAPHHLAVGVKAVIRLDPGRIEDRFGVRPGEGAAHAIVGDCTQGIGGGGFLYTNQGSVSLGVVLRLDALQASGRSTSDVFEHCVRHPGLEPYLRDGEIIEYGAHLVAEGGYGMLGEIAGDGLVVAGEAAGLTINNGFTVRGMDLAVGSGIAAADGVAEAIGNGDVSAAGLAGYRRRLEESFVLKDLRTYARAPKWLERDRLYGAYGELSADVLRRVFSVGTSPHRPLRALARAALSDSRVRVRDLVSDGWSGVRAL